MKSRTVTDRKEIEEIIRNAQYCYLSMTDFDHLPYVIPMNFGYQDSVFYFHGARNGKKIRILKAHPDVCIALSTDQILRWQDEDVACSYSMRYRSVLAHGKAEFIEDPEEKKTSLDILMDKFSRKAFKFNPPSIREVCCWKVKVDQIECRIYGY
jgi:uncharacterized protein